ncbi:MAG: isoprenylcysteine carboxylmethyltransferase family protein [Alphaproteobacteria bacterium]|jgi:protein-S-isoprenylcysteine O-methyltransferase Ste14|nr:isoprenylcysteine carboxylmethyltransferase family protein [Alphaproteobacteria bacterium]
MKTKIPPPIIALICIFINYLSTYLINPIKFPNIEIIGGLILLLGVVTAVLATLLFKKDKTTVNPRNPEKTTTLVTNGIFSITRNPMYLGLFFSISSTILFFGSWFGIIILMFFVWYINKFQIIPEEEAMEKLFGGKYSEYRQKVRRWI